MDVIKCFWFWKLLKQLFIISLISCFILLGSSFVNWEWIYRDVNEEFMSPWSSTYSQKILSSSAWILEGAWTTKALIYWKYNNNSSNNRLATFWRWTDNKLYWYVPKAWSNVRFSYRKYTKLWVFAGTWFEVLTTNQMSSWIPVDNTFSVDTYYSNSNFINKVSRFAYYMESSTNLHYSFCWIFDSLNTSICIFNINWFYDELWTSATASNDYNPPISWLSHIPADFDNSLIWTSPWTTSSLTPTPWGQIWTPWTWSRLNWRLVVNSWYTNSDMIKWFECVGLQPALCYWWFDIDNIFNPSEQFEDFTWYRAGQGATIFEIYNLYSWNFTSLNQFLNTVLTRYQNWQINSFKTEPKALLMLWAQMNTAWFKTSYIANYCNLLLNENNNNIYSWNSVDDLRVQSCLRSQTIWDSLREWVQDIWFQTSTWWVFSWWDIYFDPNTFFSNIMDTIDRNLNQNLSWWAVGLLPWYIVIVFLGLVFIRLITH